MQSSLVLLFVYRSNDCLCPVIRYATNINKRIKNETQGSGYKLYFSFLNSNGGNLPAPTDKFGLSLLMRQ